MINYISQIFRFLFATHDSLTNKSFSASFWSITIRIGSRIITLLRTFILARLLSPNDFGLFGVIMLSIAILEHFSNTGFSEALIQKKAESEQWYNVAWLIQIIRGLLLGIILFLGAPLIASFFNNPQLTDLIRVLSLVFMIRGFYNIGVVKFLKELELKKQFVFEFATAIVDFTVSTCLAFIFKSVWALLIGFMCSQVTQLFLSYVLLTFKPKLYFNPYFLKQLLSFGKWVFGGTIFVFLLTEGDDVFVGRFLGTESLGFYQMAYTISNIPATEISSVINQVTFPLFAKINHDKKKLSMAFQNIFGILSIIIIPISALIFILSEHVVYLFLGDNWSRIIPIVKILSIWGGIRGLGALTSPFLQALGKPKLIAFFQGMMVFLMALAIYPLTKKYGLIGTSFSVLVPAFITFIIRIPYITKEVNLKYWDIIQHIIYPLMSCLAIVYLFSLLKPFIITYSILNLLFIVIMFVILYILSLKIIATIFRYQGLSIIKNTIYLFKRNLKNYEKKS